MDTVEYTSGRQADLFGDPAKRTVLMWHGAQTNARSTMGPLAERVAGHGLAVVVPDWDSHADDRGRADLLASLEFAGNHSPDGLILVGWSLGGVAAAGATLSADHGLAHTVCLAGAFMVRDPLTGEALPDDLADHRDRVPFTLLHGRFDDVIPASVTTDFASTLRDNSWPVEVAELATDHAAIAGARYDAAADRYAPATSADALDVATDVAARIAAAAR